MYLAKRPINNHWAGVILLAQPRTASTSVARAMELQWGAQRVGGHHEYTDLALERDYLVITGKRCHITAFSSFFGRAIKRGEVPPNYDVRVYWNRWRRESVWVRDRRLYWRYLPLATSVYRYETIIGDLGDLCDQVALPRLVLPHTKISRDYQVPIPDALADEIRDYFADERAELRYDT